MGFDFFDAEELFASPAVFRADKREEYGEERWLSIGWVDPVLLVVVHVVRGVHGEVTRIISARKANAYERAIYHEVQN